MSKLDQIRALGKPQIGRMGDLIPCAEDPAKVTADFERRMRNAVQSLEALDALPASRSVPKCEAPVNIGTRSEMPAPNNGTPGKRGRPKSVLPKAERQRAYRARKRLPSGS